MSLACFVNVSSESLPLLTKLPRSLCLALSTICGRSSLKSAHGAADRLHQHQRDGTDDDHDRQHEHRGAQPPAPAEPPLHRSHHRQEDGDAEDGDEDHEQDVRDRRQRPRDATTPATSRIVRIEIETSTPRRPVSLAPEGDSAATICVSYRMVWTTSILRNATQRGCVQRRRWGRTTRRCDHRRARPPSLHQSGRRTDDARTLAGPGTVSCSDPPAGPAAWLPARTGRGRVTFPHAAPASRRVAHAWRWTYKGPALRPAPWRIGRGLSRRPRSMR